MFLRLQFTKETPRRSLTLSPHRRVFGLIELLSSLKMIFLNLHKIIRNQKKTFANKVNLLMLHTPVRL